MALHVREYGKATEVAGTIESNNGLHSRLIPSIYLAICFMCPELFKAQRLCLPYPDCHPPISVIKLRPQFSQVVKGIY